MTKEFSWMALRYYQESSRSPVQMDRLAFLILKQDCVSSFKFHEEKLLSFCDKFENFKLYSIRIFSTTKTAVLIRCCEFFWPVLLLLRAYNQRVSDLQTHLRQKRIQLRRCQKLIFYKGTGSFPVSPLRKESFFQQPIQHHFRQLVEKNCETN